MCNIKIKNLSCLAAQSFLLDDISYTLRKNKTLSIIGIGGSGKTTLVKAMCGLIPYIGEISIDGEKNHEFFSSKIQPVFYENILLPTAFIQEFLAVYTNNQEDLEELNDYFMINKILQKMNEELSFQEKVLLVILMKTKNKPNYLVLDDLLIYLDYRTKVLLLNYLNSKGILLIQVTSDLENVLFTDYVLCLYNGKIAIDGKSLDVLKNEKLLKRMGFSLPFYADLSIQLELYGLIKKMYLNKEDLVRNLWK